MFLSSNNPATGHDIERWMNYRAGLPIYAGQSLKDHFTVVKERGLVADAIVSHLEEVLKECGIWTGDMMEDMHHSIDLLRTRLENK